MKKIRQHSTFFILLAVISILMASCASSTNIYSTPKGADVYMNGMKVGVTPYTMTDTKIVGTITDITLRKDGYEDYVTQIVRNEETDVGAIVGGIFLLFPFLWVQKYSPVHSYELVPYYDDVEALDGPPKAYAPEEKISGTMAERIRELKELLDDGLITQEEYDKAKTKILEEN